MNLKLSIVIVALALLQSVADEKDFLKNLNKQIQKEVKVERIHRMTNFTCTVLAFVSREDERPWFVENALLLVKDEKWWLLAHVVRNPKYPNGKPASKWGHHHVFDAPWAGDRKFDHRPTKEEVQKFLADTNWQWHSEARFFHVVKRVVNDEAWKELLQMDPPVSNKDKTGISPLLY